MVVLRSYARPALCLSSGDSLLSVWCKLFKGLPSKKGESWWKIYSTVHCMGISCEKQERVRRPALRVYTLSVENGVAGVKEKTERLPLLSGAQVLDLAGHLGYLILQALRRRQGRWSVEKKKMKHREKSHQSEQNKWEKTFQDVL